MAGIAAMGLIGLTAAPTNAGQTGYFKVDASTKVTCPARLHAGMWKDGWGKNFEANIGTPCHKLIGGGWQGEYVVEAE